LAKSHDTQKKSVSLSFTAQGKRQVRVGYVVENPIWKTSYRLVLDKKGKPFLQGWAMVENVQDEDWTNVRMGLISGRPISFQMDLYQPLYVPRPVVEPELFASLRPPTYTGAMEKRDQAKAAAADAERLAEPAAAATPPLPPGQMTGAGFNFLGATIKTGGKLADQRMNLQEGVASAATATELGDYFQYAIDHPVNLPRQKS